MGVTTFFNANISSNNQAGKTFDVCLELQDDHNIPTLKIVNADSTYTVIPFENWDLFLKFADSIEVVTRRLQQIK